MLTQPDHLEKLLHSLLPAMKGMEFLSALNFGMLLPPPPFFFFPPP